MSANGKAGGKLENLCVAVRARDKHEVKWENGNKRRENQYQVYSQVRGTEFIQFHSSSPPESLNSRSESTPMIIISTMLMVEE